MNVVDTEALSGSILVIGIILVVAASGIVYWLAKRD